MVHSPLLRPLSEKNAQHEISFFISLRRTVMRLRRSVSLGYKQIAGALLRDAKENSRATALLACCNHAGISPIRFGLTFAVAPAGLASFGDENNRAIIGSGWPDRNGSKAWRSS
jgi:hypothetical protein